MLLHAQREGADYLYVAAESVEELLAAPAAPILPLSRREEIASVTDPALRRAKEAVWVLLGRMAREYLGRETAELDPVRNAHGKWCSPLCHLSLSHTDTAVAVALSSRPVGVDLEARYPRPETARRFLTPAEQACYEQLPEAERADFLLLCWTKKEALFKQSDLPHFLPSQMDTASLPSTSLFVDVGGARHAVSWCCADQ